MKTWPGRMALWCSIIVLLGSAAPPPAGPAAAGPHPMPPHPRLLEEYEAGRLPIPDFIANPDLWRAKGIDSPAEPTALLGSLNALAVVVDFSDKVQTVTATYFDTMIFAVPVVGRGSVYDYFDEVSYGQIDIVTVNLPSSMGWIRAPSTYATYVNGNYCIYGTYPNNCQKLAEDVVAAVDSVVNFANYDNNLDGTAEPIMLIHAGRGAEFSGSVDDVWSHSWNMSSATLHDGVWVYDYVIMPEYWQASSLPGGDMTIGVFAHEMGHGFWNLPDLYDRDPYDSEGIGDWSLMAGGSWNGVTSAGGDSPAWPDAWSRVQMGVTTPSTILSDVTGASIPQALGNQVGSVLKLDSATLGAQEYYLLENRQQVSGAYDEYLPGEGLFIWHIDEEMWDYSLQNDYQCTTQPNYNCSDTFHYLVRLAQADGALDLENGSDRGDAGDLYPGSSNNRSFTMLTDPESSSYYTSADSCIGVTNISNSLDTMTADLDVTCPPPTAPTGLNATPVSDTQIDLTWTDLSSDETNFRIERSPNGSTGWTEIGTSPANTPSFSSTSLACDTPYYYRVRAYRAGDGQYSTYSNTANATTMGCFRVYLPLVLRNYTAPAAPPTAPTGLNATPISDSQINLTWSDLSSDESDFHVERSPNGSSGWTEIGTSPANTPSYSSTSLTCNTPYYYRVRAHRAGDNQYSAFSNTANATTNACTGPVNGDFESGQVAWSESSTHGWDLIINSGFPGGVTPHGGSWAVWLGGDYDDISTIAQSVTVPAGAPYLGYWHWIASEDVCGWDYGFVRVGATLVDELDLCETNNTGGWVHRVVNLTAYAGTTVNLQIEASADSSYNSNWFIDDVAFQASASPSPTGARRTPAPWDWVPRIAVGQEATWPRLPVEK